MFRACRPSFIIFTQITEIVSRYHNADGRISLNEISRKKKVRTISFNANRYRSLMRVNTAFRQFDHRMKNKIRGIHVRTLSYRIVRFEFLRYFDRPIS